MAKLRVFISSTYYDLKHIRTTIESFVDQMGYEAILSEKGSIAYNPDQPLDESCYKEAQAADIFVLIIGGRYGSATSSEKEKPRKDFFDRYESITKKEFESAITKDIPVYILIDRAVFNEYDTFKLNRKSKETKYAHVDSVNIFHFLDDIVSKPRNNPIHQFDKHSEILEWLRMQWAGLFQELLLKRNQQKQISSLENEVSNLSEINQTLKTYLEAIISGIPKNKTAGQKLIHKEDKRLEESRKSKELEEISVFENFMRFYNVSFEDTKKLYVGASSIKDLLSKMETETNGEINSKELFEIWKADQGIIDKVNKVREILGSSPLSLEN